MESKQITRTTQQLAASATCLPTTVMHSSEALMCSEVFVCWHSSILGSDLFTWGGERPVRELGPADTCPSAQVGEMFRNWCLSMGMMKMKIPCSIPLDHQIQPTNPGKFPRLLWFLYKIRCAGTATFYCHSKAKWLLWCEIAGNLYFLWFS